MFDFFEMFHIGLSFVLLEIAFVRGLFIFYDEEFNHDSNLILDYLFS